MFLLGFFPLSSSISSPMARILLITLTHRPFPSPPLPAASTLSILRRLSMEPPSIFPPTPVHHRNHLLLPFSPHPPSFQGFNADLVDNTICNLSSTMTHAEDPGVAPEPEEAARDGEGELGFDEIEDMRVRRKLFYKMDRDSKEYEECSFRFHKTKSARNREKVRKSREKPKDRLVSRGDRNDGVGHCEGKTGAGDGGRKERRKLGLSCGGEVDPKLSMSKEAVRHKLVSGDDGKNGLSGSEDGMRLIDGRKKERRKLGRDSGGDVHQKSIMRKEDLKHKLVSRDDRSSGLGCSDAKTGLFDCRRKESSKLGLASEDCKVGTDRPLMDSEHKESSDGVVVLGSNTGSPSTRLITRDTRILNLERGAIAQTKLMEGKKARTLTYNQLTDPYHLPFCLDIYITKGSVRACIIHRVSSKVVVVAHSISKDMKFDLTSRKDATACAAVGSVLAQRAIADDIHNVVYTPRKGEKMEGKLQIVLQSIIDNGIDVKLKIKKRRPFKTYEDSNPGDALKSGYADHQSY